MVVVKWLQIHGLANECRVCRKWWRWSTKCWSYLLLWLDQKGDVCGVLQTWFWTASKVVGISGSRRFIGWTQFDKSRIGEVSTNKNPATRPSAALTFIFHSRYTYIKEKHALEKADLLLEYPSDVLLDGHLEFDDDARVQWPKRSRMKNPVQKKRRVSSSSSDSGPSSSDDEPARKRAKSSGVHLSYKGNMRNPVIDPPNHPPQHPQTRPPNSDGMFLQPAPMPPAPPYLQIEAENQMLMLDSAGFSSGLPTVQAVQGKNKISVLNGKTCLLYISYI